MTIPNDLEPIDVSAERLARWWQAAEQLGAAGSIVLEKERELSTNSKPSKPGTKCQTRNISPAYHWISKWPPWGRWRAELCNSKPVASIVVAQGFELVPGPIAHALAKL